MIPAGRSAAECALRRLQHPGAESEQKSRRHQQNGQIKRDAAELSASIMISFGRCMIAQAMFSRRFMPPENVDGRSLPEQSGEIERFFHAVLKAAAAAAVQLRKKGHVLGSRQVLIDRELLRYETG